MLIFINNYYGNIDEELKKNTYLKTTGDKISLAKNRRHKFEYLSFYWQISYDWKTNVDKEEITKKINDYKKFINRTYKGKTRSEFIMVLDDFINQMNKE